MANNQEVKLPASEFTEQTVANITEAGTSDFVAGYTLSGGKANRRFSLSNIANYVLNKFKLSLGGSNQTVKSAVDTLNSNKAEFKNLSRGTDSVGSLDDVKTAFTTRASAVPSGISFFILYFSVEVPEFPGGGCWSCKLTKSSDIYWDVECTYSTGYSASAIYPVFVKYENGSWTFKNLTTDINTLNSKTGTGAGYHNSIYRGKYLGTSVTDAQWSAISSGSFDDLFIGDYWTINSVNWRIAAFDYWLNCGDTNCTTHHVVIVPDTNLLSGDGSTTHWMNTSNTTVGGCMGSGFYTGTNEDNTENTGKAQCLSKIEAAFGSSHILQHREYLSNAVTNGYVSGGAWVDSKVELMNESMVYGNKFFENVMNGTNIPAAYTIDKGQLPLFALEPSRICNRAAWWLRSVVSASYFARVADNGLADSSGASSTWVGLRPAFAIK